MKLPLLLKSLFSRESLDHLYEMRRLERPTENNRTPVTFLIVSALALLILAFVLNLSNTRQDVSAFIKSSPGLRSLSGETNVWQVHDLVQKSCDGAECYRQLTLSAENLRPIDIFSHIDSYPKNLTLGTAVVGLFRLTLTPDKWRFFSDQPVMYLSLPSMDFIRAEVWVNGRRHTGLYASDFVFAAFVPAEQGDNPLVVDIVVESTKGSPAVINHQNMASKPLTQVMLSTVLGWTTYREFIANDNAGRGDWPGILARIILALFVLVLFMFVDSSPETLGLGLFLGFEAIAWALSAFNFGGTPIDMALKHFCFQMGDIFRVYYVLHLARVISGKTGLWLIWGAVTSVIYGALRQYGVTNNLDWLNYIPVGRDIFAGTVGTVFLARGLIHLRGRNLPYRQASLFVAFFACVEQVLNPLAKMYPVLSQIGWFQSASDMLQPVSAYLFVISALINISTLENRVKELSTAQTDLAKKEVQKATRIEILERFLTDSISRRFVDDLPLAENLKMVLTPRPARASLLQADIRNYSTVAGNLDSMKVVELLQSVFKRTVDSAQAFAQVKIIGDAIFLFIEENDGESQRCVVEQAIELGHLLAVDAWQTSETFGVEVKLGIAIHYGEMTIGNLSSELCIDYTVVGLEVNKVARLEELTKNPKITAITGNSGLVLSQGAYQKLKNMPDRMIEKIDLDAIGCEVRSFRDEKVVYGLNLEKKIRGIRNAA